LLTDQGFAKRLKDLFEYQPEPTIPEIHRLKIGRHYRFSPAVKIVVGRNEYENDLLVQHRQPGEILVYWAERPGPYCIISGTDALQHVNEAVQLCLAYGDGADGESVKLVKEVNDSRQEIIGMIDKSKRFPEKRL
jgi:hypothetical protein